MLINSQCLRERLLKDNYYHLPASSEIVATLVPCRTGVGVHGHRQASDESSEWMLRTIAGLLSVGFSVPDETAKGLPILLCR